VCVCSCPANRQQCACDCVLEKTNVDEPSSRQIQSTGWDARKKLSLRAEHLCLCVCVCSCVCVCNIFIQSACLHLAFLDFSWFTQTQNKLHRCP
jgi:hypothetical protein